VVYSLLLFLCYRPLTRPDGVRVWQSRKVIETTTAEQRSLGESSFIARREGWVGIDKKGLLLLAVFGYVVLCVGFAIAFILLSRSPHA